MAEETGQNRGITIDPNSPPIRRRYTPPPDVFRPLTPDEENVFPYVTEPNIGFFNAKGARRLEEGLKKIDYPKRGNVGVLVIDDGPETEVTIQEISYPYNPKGVIGIFRFEDKNGKIFDMPADGTWEFYTRTEPVPFEPRKPYSNPNSRKSRKNLKGGFYPSVYGGVSGATVLAPLIARQCLRMYNTKKRKSKHGNKKNKSLRKKKLHNSTR